MSNSRGPDNGLSKLLAQLQTDSESGAARYELIRGRLNRLFRWRGFLHPEEMADETFDMVTGNLQRGKVANDIEQYIFSAASSVGSQAVKRLQQERAAFSAADGYGTLPFYESSAEPNPDRDRLSILDQALQALSVEDRSLVLSFYEGEKGERARGRKELAEGLGITPNALRIRAYRLRLRLEEIITGLILSSSDNLSGSDNLSDSGEKPETKSPEQGQERFVLDYVNDELYRKIVENPELMKSLHWRTFERLLAEMLESLGYEIDLRRGTKDGGVDIFAISNSAEMGRHRYLVQAKRWKNKVGVEPVRQLLFLREHHRVTKACLATTSLFTKGAWTLGNQYKWQLELRDLEGIREWARGSLGRRTAGGLVLPV